AAEIAAVTDHRVIDVAAAGRDAGRPDDALLDDRGDLDGQPGGDRAVVDVRDAANAGVGVEQERAREGRHASAGHAGRLVADVVHHRVLDGEGGIALVEAVVADVGDDRAANGLIGGGTIDVDAIAVEAERLLGAAADAGPPGVLDEERVTAREKLAADADARHQRAPDGVGPGARGLEHHAGRVGEDAVLHQQAVGALRV